MGAPPSLFAARRIPQGRPCLPPPTPPSPLPPLSLHPAGSSSRSLVAAITRPRPRTQAQKWKQPGRAGGAHAGQRGAAHTRPHVAKPRARSSSRSPRRLGGPRLPPRPSNLVRDAPRAPPQLVTGRARARACVPAALAPRRRAIPSSQPPLPPVTSARDRARRGHRRATNPPPSPPSPSSPLPGPFLIAQAARRLRRGARGTRRAREDRAQTRPGRSSLSVSRVLAHAFSPRTRARAFPSQPVLASQPLPGLLLPPSLASLPVGVRRGRRGIRLRHLAPSPSRPLTLLPFPSALPPERFAFALPVMFLSEARQL